MTTLAQANRVGVKAGIQLGLPLETPSAQTIIPVILGNRNGGLNADGAQAFTNGTILGWFSIARQVFTDQEDVVTMPEGDLPVISVTLPALVQGSPTHRVTQYMAAVYNDLDVKVKPWLGYAGFLDTRDSQYAMQWLMPTEVTTSRLNRGPLLSDLIVRMDVDAGGAPPPVDPPVAVPATLRWAVSASMANMAADCGFFDFNWVELFQAQTQGYEPLKIEIVSNPSGGEFKTTIVPFPTVLPQGSVEFNTLRIIKLKDVAPGSYIFNYAITDTHGGRTPVVFTLTVV